MECETCWRCNGTKLMTIIVCGWCYWNKKHSSCDDSWTYEIPCEVCQEISE